jgi:ribonuclease R
VLGRFHQRRQAHRLFRVHEGPTPEKQEILRNYLKAMGVSQTIGDNPKAGRLPADRPRNQRPARSAADPHHAVALDAAGDLHTDQQRPLRTRLRGLHALHQPDPAATPDLLVHRVIKAILARKRYELPALPTPGEAHAKLSKRLASRAKPLAAGEVVKKPSVDTLAWQAAGLHCSANERRADEASRDVEAWLKCKYMREHLGEEFSGVVSSVTSFGLFVTLDAMYVEGLVHITELGGEYFRFDEARQELRGERTGIRYALGSRVQVQVSRVDLDGRRIDFRLVSGNDDLLLRAMRDKTGVPGAPEGNVPPARAGKARRGRDAGPQQGRQGGALPPTQEVKSAGRKAPGKKTERGGARSTASQSRKSRR